MKSLLVDCIKVTLFALLCTACCVEKKVGGAPIPRPRPAPSYCPAGSWDALWSGSSWPTVMLPCGAYVAERPGGPRYEGRWSVTGHKLTIEERLVSREGYGTLYRYTFFMRPGKHESTCGGLRLVPVR